MSNAVTAHVVAPPQAMPAKRPTPAQEFAAILGHIIENPQLTPDHLDAFLRVRRELVAEQQREDFHEAFAAMSAELPQVQKNGTVELVKSDGRRMGAYKFAKWEDMDKVLRPILSRHGFSLRFNNATVDGRLVVRAFLMRAGFEVSADSPAMPPDTGPGRNALQASGSAASYGKRYAAEAVLNIVRQGEDTDGVGALETVITADQVKQLQKLIAETKTDTGKFLQTMVTGVDSLAEIRARDFARVVNALNDKKNRGKGGGK